MPSAAHRAYQKNRIDVVRLIASHGKLHSGTPGKKGLGHITRSGVVMLCASWELYAESVLREGLAHLLSRCSRPLELPLIVQKELAKHVREAKHELKCLHLANDGWRIVLLSHAEQICNALNTPKAGPLDALFHKFLGLESLSDKWSCGGNTLNGFVGVRGDIAHRGRAATYVTLEKLKDQLSLIDCAAKETDNAVREHIRTATAKRHQPWKIIL